MSDTRTPIVYTVPEVAAILKVGKSSLYRRIAAKELPVIHVGGAVRVTAKALNDYIAGLEDQARAA